VCRQAIHVRIMEECGSDESAYQTHKEHVIGKIHAEGKYYTFFINFTNFLFGKQILSGT